MTTPLIAINQYGDNVILDGKAPRKELADKYGVPSSSLFKIYRDTKDGQTKHVGYGLLGMWFDLYQMAEWQGGGA